MTHIWTTQDGVPIEVQWMTTPHLIHSFNMLLRKNNFNRVTTEQRIARTTNDVFGAMYAEIDKRQRLKWNMLVEGANKIDVDGVKRETPVQMAMLRAVLDTGKQFDKLSMNFHNHPQSAVDQIMADPVKFEKEIVKFTEYRLAQA